jgi:adenine-specific DNA-methyltransferase
VPEAWQRIWHGKSEVLAERIPDGKLNCIITDPPFGVDNQSNMAVTTAGKKYARKIANDSSPEEAIAIFQKVMSVLLPKFMPNGDVYIFTSYQVLKEWLVMCDDLFGMWDFKRKAVIPWIKDGPGMGDLEVPWGMGMEFILFYRRGRVPKRVERRNAALYVSQLRPDKLIHPHEKPLPLLEKLLLASTDEDSFTVDPFAGSCSLARAGRNVERNVLCIEYDETNYELAKRAYNESPDSVFG